MAPALTALRSSGVIRPRTAYRKKGSGVDNRRHASDVIQAVRPADLAAKVDQDVHEVKQATCRVDEGHQEIV